LGQSLGGAMDPKKESNAWNSRNQPSGDVEFHVADRDVAIVRGRVEQAAPVGVRPVGRAFPFGLPLALDAAGGIGQGLEPRHGDVGPAVLADAVAPLAHPLQGGFGSGELLAFDLGQLGADLVMDRIEGRVDHVAGRLAPELLERAQVAGQDATQRIASLDQDFAEIQDRIFADITFTLVSDPGCAEGTPPFR